MIKCGLCGKCFNDNEFDQYAAHVTKCAHEQKVKAENEKMKHINEELQALKDKIKDCEKAKTDFKAKYPDVYKMNFENKKADNANRASSCTSPYIRTYTNNEDFAKQLTETFEDLMNKGLRSRI